jgi:hypothetical protein
VNRRVHSSAAQASTSAEAIGSNRPTTWAEKMPPGANTAAKPGDAAYGPGLPWRMYTVSGEPVNLKSSDWMNANATHRVSSQWPCFLSRRRAVPSER